MKIGFAGAGIMGAPMARHLAEAGHDVRLWNRTREKAEEVEGVTVADSPESAAEGADILVTMLADGDAVMSVAPSFVNGDAPWVQMSTVGLEATRSAMSLASRRGVSFVDAPVLGTKEPAEQGQLVVLASGPDEAIDQADPIFQAVGSKTIRLGESDAATRMKLVLNAWLVSLVEGLAETIALAQSIDVDPTQFLEIIDGAPMGTPYAQLKGKAMIEREFAPSFPLSLAHKDAKLVLAAAEEAGIELPAVQAIERQFGRAASHGHGDADMAAVFLATAT
jgi:3-hydroxyisobutyrate dehydrogenase